MPSRLPRPAKLVIALAAAVGLAIAISACAFLKLESLRVSQLGGIGSARVQLEICSTNLMEEDFCGPNSSSEEDQYLLAIAVPPGSVPPATITASPLGSGPPLVFTRNEQVAAEFTAAVASNRKVIEEEDFDEPSEREAAEALFGKPWPPSGLQGVGYLSAPQNEPEGTEHKWLVAADFGLPTPADGGAFAGPFKAAIAFGVREVEPGLSGDRPVRCVRFDEPGSEAFCSGTLEFAEVGTSDLKIPAPQPATALVGGSGSVPFALNFGNTAPGSPTFALTGTTTVPGGKVTLVSGATYVPGPVAADTHRATTTSTAQVSVPKGAKPGTYQVTLTATVPGGGSVSQVAQLKVKKPTLRLGKVKLNKGKGTATLFAKVSDPGTLSVSGKGIAAAKARAKKPKTLKLTIKPLGKVESRLALIGSARVKLKITFKPTSGIAVKKTKSVSLALS